MSRLSLEDLISDRHTITLEFLGHDVTVIYKPSVYTPEVIAHLGVMPTWEFVVKIVEGWDVVDGDAPVAISEETVSALPITFLRAVTAAIIDDINSVGKVEGRSADGSPPAEP